MMVKPTQDSVVFGGVRFTIRVKRTYSRVDLITTFRCTGFKRGPEQCFSVFPHFAVNEDGKKHYALTVQPRVTGRKRYATPFSDYMRLQRESKALTELAAACADYTDIVPGENWLYCQQDV
jgi:hypothetical protein